MLVLPPWEMDGYVLFTFARAPDAAQDLFHLAGAPRLCPVHVTFSLLFGDLRTEIVQSVSNLESSEV